MSKRLVVVSNRLPLVIERSKGTWTAHPGSGGLVTALNPVLRRRGGLWIGWPGTCTDDHAGLNQMLEDAGREAGFAFDAVHLTDEERDRFYYGFSNEIIWPLFHDLHMRCNYNPAYWEAYRTVNRKFAAVVKDNLQPDDFIWVHDYHLMNVADDLRAAGVSHKIGFFLHIPFPPPEIFLKLPWRFDVLEALLQFDVLGFQTQGYRRNFVHCIRSVMPGISVRGRGRLVAVKTPQRDVRAGVFPISIDFDEFASQAATPQVSKRARQIRHEFPHQTILLGIDRLDYTKGIPERLRGFENALERYPDLRGKVALVQVVVPSRTAIGEYKDLKSEIDQLVGEINGRYTVPGWAPIHYVFRSLDRTELAAFYRAAHVMVVTPLRDGMNLVAKEYCACRPRSDGVLVLSEFAGTAAAVHRWALLVNPHDVVGMGDTLYNAVVMDRGEQRLRMRGLRRLVRKQDVFWWLDLFLAADQPKNSDADAPIPVEHDLHAIIPPSPAPRPAVPEAEPRGAL